MWGKWCRCFEWAFVHVHGRCHSLWLHPTDRAGLCLRHPLWLACWLQMKREFAAAERIRLSSLGREEMLKEEANKLFQVRVPACSLPTRAFAATGDRAWVVFVCMWGRGMRGVFDIWGIFVGLLWDIWGSFGHTWGNLGHLWDIWPTWGIWSMPVRLLNHVPWLSLPCPAGSPV